MKHLGQEPLYWRCKTSPNPHMHNSKKVEKIRNKLSAYQMECYLLGSFIKGQNEVIRRWEGE